MTFFSWKPKNRSRNHMITSDTVLESWDIILFVQHKFGQHLLTSVDFRQNENVEKSWFYVKSAYRQSQFVDQKGQQMLTKIFKIETLMSELSKSVSTILISYFAVLLCFLNFGRIFSIFGNHQNYHKFTFFGEIRPKFNKT